MLPASRFRVPALTAVAAAAIAIALPANPALASTHNHLCESFGRFCVAAGSLNHGTFLLENTPGRDLRFAPPPNVGHFGQFEGHKTGVLKFAAASNTCAAGTPHGFGVTARDCSGISGVTWAQVSEGNGRSKYINVAETKATHEDIFLAGENERGVELSMESKDSTHYETFTWK